VRLLGHDYDGVGQRPGQAQGGGDGGGFLPSVVPFLPRALVVGVIGVGVISSIMASGQISAAKALTSEGLWFAEAASLAMVATDIDAALFVWLISHDRKYCWLFYCERKTLLNGRQIRLVSSSEQGGSVEQSGGCRSG